MGFFTVLFLVFLVLKLIGSITWSWLLVFSPLIGDFAVFAIFMLISGATMKAIRPRRRAK